MRNKLIFALVLLFVALAICGLYKLAQRFAANNPPPASNGGAPPGGNPPPASGFPELAAKPQPRLVPFNGCPPEGDGGDRELNRLKNRTDDGNYLPVSFAAVLALPFPATIEQRYRRDWSRADRAAVARFEGTPVSIEGYFARARLQNPESCNCHGADNHLRDFHLWLTDTPTEDRRRAIVVEPSPALRARNPAWTIREFNRLIKARQRVRVSGWLLLDQEHPEQINQTRGTIWEIHPLMRVEVQAADGRWIDMNDLR